MNMIISGRIFTFNIYLILCHFFRLEWEGSILRGSSALHKLEEERLTQLADKAGQYLAVMKANR